MLLPIILALETVRVGLAGAGEGRARRQGSLAAVGVTPVPVSDNGTLPSIHVLFIAGLDPAIAAALAGRARHAGILVNVEDAPELCDFHVPAIVRRGDLLLTASTGGRAPGLARRVREWLEERFGPEWSGRVEHVGQARAAWRSQGLAPVEVATRTRAMVSEQGWLQ
ncbi:MAG TPA: NAD(P)-dependent oxidoreductase [Rhizomicrobium sp.]|nr:NAD(P)-dependent oxidoreductase [Rhizomicrobium sp.]